MTPEEILKLADKNGFDWFGIKCQYENPIDELGIRLEDGNCYQIICWDKEYPDDGIVLEFSKADLATTKSFLDALTIYKNDIYSHWKHLQLKLIEDLTNNNGQNFWQIISDFIK